MYPSYRKRNVVFYEKKKLKKLYQKLKTAKDHEKRRAQERFEKSKIRVRNFEPLPKSAFTVSIK